jgi:hypothetical protein
MIPERGLAPGEDAFNRGLKLVAAMAAFVVLLAVLAGVAFAGV